MACWRFHIFSGWSSLRLLIWFRKLHRSVYWRICAKGCWCFLQVAREWWCRLPTSLFWTIFEFPLFVRPYKRRRCKSYELSWRKLFRSQKRSLHLTSRTGHLWGKKLNRSRWIEAWGGPLVNFCCECSRSSGPLAGVWAFVASWYRILRQWLRRRLRPGYRSWVWGVLWGDYSY